MKLEGRRWGERKRKLKCSTGTVIIIVSIC